MQSTDPLQLLSWWRRLLSVSAAAAVP